MAADGDHVALDLDPDALRDRIADRVAEAELEIDVLALDFGAESHTVDFEALLEALGNAVDGVRQQRPHKAVQRPLALGVIAATHDELRIVGLGRDAPGQSVAQAPLGSLNRHLGALDRDLDARFQRDG